MSEITVLTILSSVASLFALSLYLSEKRINSDSSQLTLTDLVYMIFSSKPSSF